MRPVMDKTDLFNYQRWAGEMQRDTATLRICREKKLLHKTWVIKKIVQGETDHFLRIKMHRFSLIIKNKPII